jgi:2-keto-4-pentenoate hydratase/2-oxohepta-3-ene-1,7-dioic acid hydratase in catechol pathway
MSGARHADRKPRRTSERIMQRSGPVPQFGLAKSFPGFGPTGPVLVTPDEFPDSDDLEIGCIFTGTPSGIGKIRQQVVGSYAAPSDRSRPRRRRMTMTAGRRCRLEAAVAGHSRNEKRTRRGPAQRGAGA